MDDAGDALDVEALLREALSPVEPPVHLVQRLEGALMSITEMAADELEAWELSAMRDPRNWARPAAAVVLGAGAGAALVLLRMRQRGSTAPGALRGAASSTASAIHDARERSRKRLRGH